MRRDRKRFFQTIDRLLSEHADTSQWLGLITCDIRDFRAINRRYGFCCGDALLSHMQHQLTALCKDPELAFYHGDDEFSLLIPNLQSPGLAGLAASKISQSLNTLMPWQQHELAIHLNIGVSTSNDAGQTDELVMASEYALAEAKRLNIAFHMEEVDCRQRYQPADLAFHSEFKHALHENELELFYQPQLVLNQRGSIHAEALIRWRHPQRGSIPPDYFLPICSQLGLNLTLAQWVINTACRQLKKWPDNLRPNIAINLSADIVDSPELPQLIANSVSIWGINPRQLTLEITESAVIADKKTGFSNLSELRKSGAKISIDDFGTGQSSLEYFKLIPADELKIDRAFIKNLDTSSADRKIVKLIVDLAHSFDMTVVAEGIESEKILDILTEMGCDIVQGYYISAAIPHDDHIQWVTAAKQ